jgi:hypothetical protein
MLRPFIVTSVHSGAASVADMEPAARKIFTDSDLSRDPNRFNVFMFVLDSKGTVVHEFHGLPGARGSNDKGRSAYEVEFQNAREKLKLPVVEAQRVDAPLKGLPDLDVHDSAVPAGVRVFSKVLSRPLPRWSHRCDGG